MKYLFTPNQRGIGHLGLIVAIVVVLAVGVGGWWVLRKNSSLTPAEKAQQAAIKNAKCESDDKDLCKFLASWKANQPYTMTVTTKQDGKETKTVFTVESSNKVHTQISGDVSYETIIIDNTLYTKAADGTWWKQTLPNTDVDKYKTNVDFEGLADGAKTSYKKLGKEPCGTNTCFKYEQIDASAPSDVKQYIWFDTKNYQARRSQTTTKQSASDTTFDFKTVKVTAPANAKELGPNQYLVPGQSEPTTLPATGDALSEAALQQLMQQYNQ